MHGAKAPRQFQKERTLSRLMCLDYVSCTRYCVGFSFDKRFFDDTETHFQWMWALWPSVQHFPINLYKTFFYRHGVMFSNEDTYFRYGNVIDLLVTPRWRPSFIDTQNMVIKGAGGRIIPTGRHFLSELNSIVKIVFLSASVCQQIFGEIL